MSLLFYDVFGQGENVTSWLLLGFSTPQPSQPQFSLRKAHEAISHKLLCHGWHARLPTDLVVSSSSRPPMGEQGVLERHFILNHGYALLS